MSRVVASGSRMPYTSPVRSEQARGTRQAIVTAAAELFVMQGFASTTIDAVADRAGVGRKTVFASVGSKAALLKLAWDWSLTGDDEPVPLAERPAVHAMLAERDPQRLVRMWADMLLDVGGRARPMGSVVLAAADVDSEARALLDTIRQETLSGATAFVTHLAGVGGLRADLPLERAADACWALMNSLLQQLLIADRGWSVAEYRDWFVRVVTASLLEPSSSAPIAPAAVVRHVPEAGRYEALVGGRVVGRLEYDTGRRFVVLLGTEVDDDREGVAGHLVRRALDDIRSGGDQQVVAVCPYAAWWIQRHPDYADVLVSTARPRRPRR